MRAPAALLALIVAGCPAPTPHVAAPPATEASPTPAPVKPDYPAAERQDVVDVIHGQEVHDPYRWLEDASDERVKRWMTAEDDFARAHLAAIPVRAKLAERLSEIYYHDETFPPVVRGDRYFYLRKGADKEKKILYWKQGADGEEKVLVDPQTLSADGSTSLKSWYPSPNGKYVAYLVNEHNADDASIHLMDVDAGKEREQDIVPGARYAAPSWTPDSRGFFYVALPTGPEREQIPVAELPGKAQVRFHLIDGGPDRTYFGPTNDPETFVGAEVSADGRYLILTLEKGWTATDIYYKDLNYFPAHARHRGRGRGSPPPPWEPCCFRPLITGHKALATVRSWGGKFYIHTNLGAPLYRVFEADPATLQQPRDELNELMRAAPPSPIDRWKEVVPEGDSTLERVQIVGKHLVLTYLRKAHSEIEIRTLEGGLVRKLALPGMGTVATKIAPDTKVTMVGTEESDEAFYTFQSFTDPPTVFRTSIASGKTSIWSKVDLPLDLSEIVVEQVWYPSRDGTKISMFLVHHKNAQRDGNNPTLLYGYGGFNINWTPVFKKGVAVWLERGGIYALPNLRGGGEYGETWHSAGMLLEKQNVFDDFIAAAEYLIQQGWTRSKRLAVSGGSNGGLLVGAFMTQRPDLARAVICTVPLLDMVRYHLFGQGRTWIGEYGSADDPKQFEVLFGYSPYHRLKQGTAYPALLMLSSESDDRVDPLHARKFVAAAQWATSSAAPILLRIEKGGHKGADLVRVAVAEDADELAFLMEQLGMY